MRGGQWQVLRLIEGLCAAGHPNILLSRAGSPLFLEARRRELDVHAWNPFSAYRSSQTADIVHAHDARSHTLAALSAARRLVVSRRVAFPVGRGGASRWKYARARHYIAVSAFVRQMLLDAGVDPSKVTVVYDGVTLAPLAHGSQIVAPASADPRKGTSLAIEAAKLAGFPIRLSQALEKDLAAAALFVYVTHSEGLGSAVLLAMAAGVPVIASNVGGLPEIVEHERTGLLTANTTEAIADAMRRLMTDRVLAEALAALARAAIEEKFSAARMVAETIAVYQTLL